MSKKIFDFVKPGVITGDDVQKVFAIAKENGFALPAVNCVGTDSVNAVLEAAAKVKAPVNHNWRTRLPQVRWSSDLRR